MEEPRIVENRSTALITLRSKTDWQEWLNEYYGKPVELMGDFIDSQSFEAGMEDEDLIQAIFAWKRESASYGPITLEIDGVGYNLSYDDFSKEFTLE
jgi:hypothetical protein